MGKVHGSLARAGKVKSQTPKVWDLSITINQTWTPTEHCRTIGRAARKEEVTQGPGLQARAVHPSLRQRHHDRWQAKDEPEPDFLEDVGR